LAIGGRQDGTLKFNGRLDSFRIHNVVRSDSWRTARYNNTNIPSTFATAGTPEDGVLPPEPTEGSGFASLITSVIGEGHTGRRGNGTTILAASSQGEGWRVSSGNGQNTLSVSVIGEGYYLPSGSGELPAIIATIGEGYAATGSYGETLLIASSSGQGYVIRSGAGLAVMQVGTVGNGQSTEPATSGILALQTIDGLYLIGF